MFTPFTVVKDFGVIYPKLHLFKYCLVHKRTLFAFYVNVNVQNKGNLQPNLGFKDYLRSKESCSERKFHSLTNNDNFFKKDIGVFSTNQDKLFTTFSISQESKEFFKSIEKNEIGKAGQLWHKLLQRVSSHEAQDYQKDHHSHSGETINNTMINRFNNSVLPCILHKAVTLFISKELYNGSNKAIKLNSKNEEASVANINLKESQEVSFFLSSIFFEYLERIDRCPSIIPSPFPLTFEIIIKWLVEKKLFEEAASLWLEMPRFDIIPRNSLLQWLTQQWIFNFDHNCLYDTLNFGAFPDLFEQYTKASIPLSLETLMALKETIRNSSFNFGQISKISNRTSINLLKGLLRISEDSEALYLFYKISHNLTEEESEVVYNLFLKYYSVSDKTADLFWFNSLADHLLNLPYASPSQIPSRAYFLACQEQTALTWRLKKVDILPSSVLKTIVIGYANHQEFESVAQILQLILTRYFNNIEICEDLYKGIFDGLARHGSVSSFKFFLNHWRKHFKTFTSIHPWFPEFYMIERLVFHRHLNVLPQIVYALLSSTERRREILDHPTECENFGFDIFQRLHAQTSASEEITEILINSDGTPPYMWAGWLSGFIEKKGLLSHAMSLHNRYTFNTAHKIFPPFSFEKLYSIN